MDFWKFYEHRFKKNSFSVLINFFLHEMLFDTTSTIKLNVYHLCTVIQFKLVL